MTRRLPLPELPGEGIGGNQRLPWTRAAFNIAAYTLLPFGQKVVSRAVYFGARPSSGGSKK
jgi:hypothetical protein